jgi:hypothetical protein
MASRTDTADGPGRNVFVAGYRHQSIGVEGAIRRTGHKLAVAGWTKEGADRPDSRRSCIRRRLLSSSHAFDVRPCLGGLTLVALSLQTVVLAHSIRVTRLGCPLDAARFAPAKRPERRDDGQDQRQTRNDQDEQDASLSRSVLGSGPGRAE